MTEVHVIELWPATTECIVCGRETPFGYGLAMYEDEIVPDDAEEWAGFPCCEQCYDLNEGRVGVPFTSVWR